MPRKASLKTLRKKAWDACSKYIRQLYSDHRGKAVCYTCGTLDDWKSSQAGHGIPGRTNAVLFDTEIIRVQCETCNIWKRGMHHIFTAKLIKENGLEWYENKLQQSKQIVKLGRSDYEQIAQDFTLKTQQLIVERKAQKWVKS